MDRPFVISHLSDLHLTADDDESRSEPRLWGRLRGMNGNLRHLLAHNAALRESDRILVTGDVSDRGELAAWEVLDRGARRVGLASRMLVLPGNHDACCLALRSRPPVVEAARVRAGLAALDQPSRFPWSAELLPGTIQLFAVDSTRRANATGVTNAIGRIGENQLIALARLLDRHRAVPVKLLALHHSPNIPLPPTSRQRGRAPSGYFERVLHQIDASDRRTLRVLCRTYRVRAVLHGHTHDDLDRRVNGVRMIGVPATTEPDRRRRLTFKRYVISPRLPHRLRAEVVQHSLD